MIVYGDPSFCISTGKGKERILELLSDARRETSTTAARELLIACGQLEQGLTDAGIDAPISRSTDLAAEILIYRLTGIPVAATTFQTLEESLAGLEDPLVRIKIPEGYAFYCLYPEQYWWAALQWIQGQKGTGTVLVVGVRSIGTSLSALVKVALSRAGFRVQRITVRPGGHPFNRTVELVTDISRFEHGLVVDEGPGLSGSSMAAVVTALEQFGMRNIVLLPGHNSEPGSAASAEIRALWNRTAKIVPAQDPDLQDQLRAISCELLNCEQCVCSDLSAGEWRTHRGFSPANMPPVATRLERTKYLFRNPDGRALLWKYAGIGAGQDMLSLTGEAFKRQNSLAEAGWTSPALASCDGFIAMEWIEGESLSVRNLSPDLIHMLAQYIGQTAQKCRTDPNSLNNLSEMVALNVQESLGTAAAERAVPFLNQLRCAPGLPAYFDGRMAPWEWIRTKNKTLKVDVWGHDQDHTCVGEQSVLWDIAGAIVEWEMEPRESASFCRELAAFSLNVLPTDLELHRLCYSAFRLGMLSLEDERACAQKYRTQVLLALDSLDKTGSTSVSSVSFR
jgi:hypothetical protein